MNFLPIPSVQACQRFHTSPQNPRFFLRSISHFRVDVLPFSAWEHNLTLKGRCFRRVRISVFLAKDPFRTAAPLWGQATQILSNLSPKRDSAVLKGSSKFHIFVKYVKVDRREGEISGKLYLTKLDTILRNNMEKKTLQLRGCGQKETTYY